MITVTLNKEIDWQTFRCRCSAIHKIQSESREYPTLTDKQAIRLAELEGKDELTEKTKAELAGLLIRKENGNKVTLSATCISYLMEEYAWVTRKMISVTKELMDVPQLQKGKIVEPQSLALLSMVDGKYYFPNEDENGNRERIFNDFLSGEVDAYEGDQIMGANAIPDVKSNWDYVIFLNKIHEPLTKANDLQVKGYLDISEAPVGFIANCLVDTPEEIINRTKEKLLYKIGCATDEDPKFKQTWAVIERSMRFGHIPPHQRVFKKNVEPMTASERENLYDRVKICRDWLSNFHETYQMLNK